MTPEPSRVSELARILRALIVQGKDLGPNAGDFPSEYLAATDPEGDRLIALLDDYDAANDLVRRFVNLTAVDRKVQGAYDGDPKWLEALDEIRAEAISREAR